MTSSVLGAISNELADAVAGVAPAVVQVQNGRRPVSGLVYADGVVLTTARALGRGDRLRVRRHDGQTFEAELAGWDPATGLAVLRVGGLDVAPVAVSDGHGPRRSHRRRGRAVVEQCDHGERRHRVGDRRAASDRLPPRHRRGHPDDRSDARRLWRRGVRRYGRQAHRRADSGGRSAALRSSSRRGSHGRQQRRSSSTAP